MAEEELQMEDGGGKSKMMIIIIVVVVLIVGGVGAFFMMSGSDAPVAEESSDMGSSDTGAAEVGAAASTAKTGTALYVAMPRPFVFNVPGAGRDRLVQIKVQLMVRGSDNEESAKMHIPMIEGTLLRVFSTANADDLVTEAGKEAIKDQSVKEVQKALLDITGNQVVEQVLFTGFVMQ